MGQFSRLVISTLLCSTLLLLTNAHAEVAYAVPLKGESHAIGVMLEWTTAFEMNSQLFVIEKSEDGVNFQQLGTVEAAGSSDEERVYRYFDMNATKGTLHYRLKQLDVDGGTNVSQSITLNMAMPNEFMVVHMGNTMIDRQFDLTVDATAEGTLDYNIQSVEGHKIQEGKFQLAIGLNEFQFDLGEEADGTYHIKLAKAQEVETITIRKQSAQMSIFSNRGESPHKK